MFLARDTPISSRPPPIPISRSQIRDDSFMIAKNEYSTLVLRKVDIGNTSRTYLVKTYHNALNQSLERFSIELACLLNPRSECYPELIAVTEDDHGPLSLVMELPHQQAWRTARPSMSPKEKNAIIQCYKDIHAHGILHGNVSLKNIIVGVDGAVTLVDFDKAYCLDIACVKGVPTCTLKALETEMRAVMYLLNYKGAREKERSQQRVVPRARRSTIRLGQNAAPMKKKIMDKWDEDAEMEELSDFFRIPGRWENALPVTASHPSPLDPMVPTQAPEIAIEEKLERIKILRMTLKRIREEEASDRLQLQEFARKHPWNTHRVAFHPDTNDNSLRSSGGRLRRRQRSSTPFPSEGNDDDRGSSSDVDMEEVSATSHQPELSSATPGPSMTLRDGAEPENPWILDKPTFFATLQSMNVPSPKPRVELA
ncbi:hypothetical protein CONPUDRAFT_161436 [Coniophora puteana RWD-64-598 SS2]|uniref:Protein kinase domain-containing protein n=1 Tax=Coniophora puteana (strain RWD-64-598) TaxID=741705 RepID=A0A5M3N695_CONPW|nr:uncharacterized protein CONPUDRAFT_161436 [Coniophora puteana RWD-64-598 SS2]EIW86778.1 hypothetical protein CONPUDRAFT_161436 [Coniophora puteana RWD-64-598 SS2]